MTRRFPFRGLDRLKGAKCRGFRCFCPPRNSTHNSKQATRACKVGRSRKWLLAMSPSSGQLSRWLLAKYLSSRSRSLAVMPLVSTAVETRRLDIHAAGSCRCSFESVLLGERPAAPAQHSSRTGLTRQPGGGLFVGSMGLCSQPHHAASVWPCQGRTTLLERTREPFRKETLADA